MIQRCWDRPKNEIPVEQAAYQPGRSTAEQVFCVKTIAEKAISYHKRLHNIHINVRHVKSMWPSGYGIVLVIKMLRVRSLVRTSGHMCLMLCAPLDWQYA